MHFRTIRGEHSALFRTLLKWILLGSWVGLLSGAATALFLHALTLSANIRENHPALLWGLPFAGIVIALLYHHYGKSVEGGNNLLLERIYDPQASIPFRLVPLILFSTVLTHLFGGSAGREGTAVQMGGTLASLAKGPLVLSSRDHRILIVAGISGGFGAVFGTPIAGMVFGLEVLTIGSLNYEALIPCFIASVVGNVAASAMGIVHHIYSAGAIPLLSPWMWILIGIGGVLFGGASFLFIEITHLVSRMCTRLITPYWMRPFLGGMSVILLTLALNSRDYLGLSLPLIERSFTPAGVFPGAFALKILFTAITIGTGFKGGEVTPLFCIGATLGAAFAKITGEPTAFFAALGFVAVFAGAANTPLACIVMGIELFGSQMAVPLTAVCILSYTLSGHRGIYTSQKIGTPKSQSMSGNTGSSLEDVHLNLHASIIGAFSSRRRNP